MNAEKRKLYQARAHLIKAETLLRQIRPDVPKKVLNARVVVLDLALVRIEQARGILYNFVETRFGKINLESYK